MIGAPLRNLIDFVWPAHCVACSACCDAMPPLCSNCLADLSRLESETACIKCGYPLAAVDMPCPHCEGKGIYPLDRVARLAVFHDPIRAMVHRMKYGGAWPLAEFLADRSVDHEPIKGLLTETEILVPVPLHPLRQFHRGYNQADVIAQRIGSRCGIPVVDALCRTRATETQVDLHSHQKRIENVRHAFDLFDGSLLRGHHVTIVDDVMTSGATISHAARALNAAKPASICGLVIAVADPKGRSFEMV
ncbi:MAG: ComF family protein [Phycisphaerae bacterium]|nr:ComF family protein [Phycisphaerae bacterium]